MSQGTNTASNQTLPYIPQWLKPLLHNTERGMLAGQKSMPSLSQLYGMVPQQGTAPFSAQQDQLINQISGLNGQLNPAEQAAQGQYNSFLSQTGPSAATEQELQNFNQMQAPAILQQAALAGQGNSGAALSALSQGQESALVPFLQQDQQDKLSAAGDLQGLGVQQYNQQTQDLQNALQAAGMPQQLAQQQADALFQQLQQQFQLAQGTQTGSSALFGNAMGGGSQTSISTPPKF